MAEVRVIELGEGFDADDVEVLADGNRVWRGDAVRTNYSVGIAEIVEVPEGADDVEVVIRRARRTQRVAIPAGLGARVRVVLDPGGQALAEPATDDPRF